MNYEGELVRLYSQQAVVAPDGYLHAHSRNRAVIRRQVEIFKRYERYLRNAGSILDWGCRHAPDACLARMALGERVTLEGCDVDEGPYSVFFDYARLRYSRLTHPWSIPYGDEMFDVVIGSGVLEHVPNDSESLKELYRVIRPSGYLVITMLPNHLSYTEWLNRTLKNPHHLRLYSLREIRYLLMHNGFLPIDWGYQQLIPSLSSPKGGIFDSAAANRLVEGLYSLNGPLERLPGLRRLATNLFVVGRKVSAFHG